MPSLVSLGINYIIYIYRYSDSPNLASLVANPPSEATTILDAINVRDQEGAAQLKTFLVEESDRTGNELLFRLNNIFDQIFVLMINYQVT